MDDPAYDDLRGNDEYKAYISVFGNYVKAEKPESRFDKEAMWLPPSPMVAGLIYKNDNEIGIQAPSAGKANGKLGGVSRTRIKLSEAKNTKINEKGVNCVLNWQGDVGDVVAMGADTLSKDPKFRNYTIKRTYDYIYKTMRNYLNQQVYKGFRRQAEEVDRRRSEQVPESAAAEQSDQRFYLQRDCDQRNDRKPADVAGSGAQHQDADQAVRRQAGSAGRRVGSGGGKIILNRSEGYLDSYG